MVENRKCPFCGKKMICVNTQDGEFTCTSCAEYANHDVLDFIDKLQAENERLKRELKQTEVQDQVVIDTLRKENERLELAFERAINFYTCLCGRLAKDNAKLKCLALHSISEVVRLTAMVSRMFAKTKGVYGHWYNPLLLTEVAIQSAYDRAHRLHKAYRKAKNSLREKNEV